MTKNVKRLSRAETPAKPLESSASERETIPNGISPTLEMRVINEQEDSAPGDAWEILRELPAAEKAFVLDVLRGASYRDAARDNGWSGELAPVRLLGRARVRAALERLAPLLPDSRRAARILSPFLMADATDAAASREPGSRDVRRDLLAIAGVVGVQRSEHVTASLSEILSALDKRADGKRPTALPPAEILSPRAALGSGDTDT